MRRTSEIPIAITEMKTQRRRPQHLLVVRGLGVGLLQTFGRKTSGESPKEKVHRPPSGVVALCVNRVFCILPSSREARPDQLSSCVRLHVPLASSLFFMRNRTTLFLACFPGPSVTSNIAAAEQRPGAGRRQARVFLFLSKRCKKRAKDLFTCCIGTGLESHMRCHLRLEAETNERSCSTTAGKLHPVPPQPRSTQEGMRGCRFAFMVCAGLIGRTRNLLLLSHVLFAESGRIAGCHTLINLKSWEFGKMFVRM